MSIRYSDDFKKEVVKAYMAGDKVDRSNSC